MANRPKGKGTMAESAVAAYLSGHGWPYAERRTLSGAFDKGDITGTPGLAWEVKYAGVNPRLGPWLIETGIERINAGAEHGILVVKPAGLGVKSVQHWYAVMIQEDLDRLMVLVDAAVSNEYAARGIVLASIVDGPVTNFTAATLHWSMQQVVKQGSVTWGQVPVLTLRPSGTKDLPQRWYRVTTLEAMTRLLRVAGYGEPWDPTT